MSENNKNLADIKDLSVSFMTDAGSIKAVEDVNFTIPRKTVVGVVGESGSGKSVTARSIIKLLPETATTSGAVYLSSAMAPIRWTCSPERRTAARSAWFRGCDGVGSPIRC